MKHLLLGFALLGLLVFSALAADLSGKWTAEVPGRGGQKTTQTFNLKADGAALTGSVTSPRGENPISDGKIDGDNLSFVTVMNFNGNEVRIRYTGKISGDSIQFTRQREGGEGPKTEFVAKKSE